MTSAFGKSPSAPADTDPCVRKPRCWRCQKLLAILVSAPYRIDCSRCKAVNQSGDHPSLAPPGDRGLPVS